MHSIYTHTCGNTCVCVFMGDIAVNVGRWVCMCLLGVLGVD